MIFPPDRPKGLQVQVRTLLWSPLGFPYPFPAGEASMLVEKHSNARVSRLREIIVKDDTVIT